MTHAQKLERLKNLAKFDPQFIPSTQYENSDFVAMSNAFNLSAEHENSRLQPLISALIKMVEKMDGDMRTISEFHNNHEPTVAAQIAIDSRAEITRLIDELLEGK